MKDLVIIIACILMGAMAALMMIGIIMMYEQSKKADRIEQKVSQTFELLESAQYK